MKRDRRGNMTAIKANHPRVKRCRRCGVTRQQAHNLSAALEEPRDR